MYDVHPAAEIFPLMSDEEFKGLVADIQEHGLREPIVLHDGKVLDGRNRVRACEELGIELDFENWPNSEDPHAYVVSKNLHRRHLNISQKAMVAAKIATMKSGTRTDLEPQPNSVEVSNVEAAQQLKIGKTSVIDAKKVLEGGTPEEIAAVESGGAAVSAVAETVRERAESGTVDEWLEAGKVLLDVRNRMSSAELNEMVEKQGHSARDARRLVQIAAHSEIGSGKWNEFLPDTLTPLSELARMTPEQFRKHMDAGDITPDLTKRAIRKLMADSLPATTPKPPSEARRIAKETGVAQVGSDGNIHFGADENEVREAREIRDQTYAVIDAVDALATMPPIEEWIDSLEPWRVGELDPINIRLARDWLSALLPAVVEMKNGK